MKKQKEKDKITRVTLPLSDTVPGPGNFSVEILNMNNDGLPVVNDTDLIKSTGTGTAHDLASTSQVPPG